MRAGMTSKHVAQIIAEEYAKAGILNLFVKYWGHDPEDVENCPDCEDHLTGMYDLYMFPDHLVVPMMFSKMQQEIDDAIEKQILFIPCCGRTRVSETRIHYPHIYLTVINHALMLLTREEI
jgi:hypothetical protein